MDEDTYNLQLQIAYLCGKQNSCGTKINFKSEITANRAALEVTNKHKEKEVEAYPCPFCNGWHIGSIKTDEDIKKILDSAEDDSKTVFDKQKKIW